jgi:peroxiredoxin-like protein
MDNTYFYEVELNWSSGRKGIITSPILDKKIEVATPPEFPNGVPGIWSPEHLLVAAVNSCLMTTFLAIAENSKLKFEDFRCNASGKLEKVDNKYLISEITVMPVLTIQDGTDEEKAARILQKAEAACLISHSVKSKIIMKPVIIVKTSIQEVLT